MRNKLLITMALAMIASAGCRTATRTVDESRADLDMPPGGNRGYLVGAAPAWEGPKKTTRKMVEMEIETPPIWRPAQQPSVSSDLTETASTSVQEMPSAVPAEERPPYTK